MDNLSAARILKILMDHRVEGVKQEDLVKYLFQTYSYSDEGQEFIFDKGRISKWVNGVEKISPSIRDFYTGECEVDLSLDLEEEVFMYIDSPEDVTADIVKCIQDDVLMKPKTKAELLEFLKEENEQRYSNFVAHTLVYAMKMQSVRKRNDSSVTNGTDRTGMQRGAYLYDGEAPEPCRYFVGRKRELEELHQRLLASGKVFVSGLPGNGKSEFAKKYALQYRDKYREIVYIDYSGDLYSDIANLDYSTDTELSTQESRFKEHNRSLKKMTQDSLLIIDNFDTTVMNEKIFPVIMKYKCKVLITTRNVFYGQEQMRLKAMEEEDLFELSCKLFSEAELWKEDLLEIYKLIHHHTFVTELISRLLATGILDPDELFEQLKKEPIAFDSEDYIQTSKDGCYEQATYRQHIRKLFRLSGLSDAMMNMMKNLSLIDYKGINRGTFGKWMRRKNLNDLNTLIELGFVQEREGRHIRIYPLLSDVLFAESQICFSECSILLGSLEEILFKPFLNVKYRELAYKVAKYALGIVVNDEQRGYYGLLEGIMKTAISEIAEPDDKKWVAERLEKEWAKLAYKDPSMEALYRYFHINFKNMNHNQEEYRIALTEAVALFPDITIDNVKRMQVINNAWCRDLLNRGLFHELDLNCRSVLRRLEDFELQKSDTYQITATYNMMAIRFMAYVEHREVTPCEEAYIRKILSFNVEKILTEYIYEEMEFQPNSITREKMIELLMERYNKNNTKIASAS